MANQRDTDLGDVIASLGEKLGVASGSDSLPQTRSEPGFFPWPWAAGLKQLPRLSMPPPFSRLPSPFLLLVELL